MVFFSSSLIFSGNELVAQSTLAEAFKTATLNDGSASNYGFGWTIQESPIGKVVQHSGSNPGYSTHIVRYIDANKTIIMLCNNQHEKFGELLSGVEKLVGGSNAH